MLDLCYKQFEQEEDEEEHDDCCVRVSSNIL